MPSYRKLHKLIRKLASSENYSVNIGRDHARISRIEDGVVLFKISIRRGMDFDISLKTLVGDDDYVRLTGNFDANFKKDPVEACSTILMWEKPKHTGNMGGWLCETCEECYWDVPTQMLKKVAREEYYWDVPTQMLKNMAREAEMILKKAIELDREGQYFISK